MPNQKYETSDFYLAAFLRTKGVKLRNVDRTNPRRVVFIFETASSTTDLVDEYMMGASQVNPRMYASIIRQLKDILYHEGGPSR